MKSAQANVIEAPHDREPASGLFAGLEAAVASGDRQPPVRRLCRHEMLFGEGDAGGKYYEVLEGVVCSFRVLHDGRRQILSFSYPGDIIGIGHERECKCSCEAVSPARVRCIPAAALARSLDARPELARKLFSVATSELASMHDHFVMVGRKSATEKLASFLLALARREVDADASTATFQLPMTRTDIADFLGLTIETVSRRFTALRKLGVIDLPQTTRVRVNDMRRLEELADGEDEIW
jgi:CRP/FNR family transcriptional regulator